MTTIYTLLSIIAIILLWNYTISLMEQNRRHKQFMKDFEEYGKKIDEEVNSISPLFNGMTGKEVREMMEKEYKQKHKLK